MALLPTPVAVPAKPRTKTVTRVGRGATGVLTLDPSGFPEDQDVDDCIMFVAETTATALPSTHDIATPRDMSPSGSATQHSSGTLDSGLHMGGDHLSSPSPSPRPDVRQLTSLPSIFLNMPTQQTTVCPASLSPQSATSHSATRSPLRVPEPSPPGVDNDGASPVGSLRSYARM